MVSTRGIKLKFIENERVLCYEPDPTKAKVLYDSKVLDVVVAKDHRGRKSVEYLIHFQGWNSSWDRYVGEEYVLKDTPENRQLQKDLAEKSQLQLGAYLYRRDKKRHNRKLSVAPSSDEGSSSSPARMDTDDGHDVTTTSDDDSSLDEDIFPIDLTPELRACLEQDYCLINTRNKLVKLPAQPNVLKILETYWQHYATNQLCDKVNVKIRNSCNMQKRRPEDIQGNLSVCTEVLDGIRIYFDYTVKDLLLYKPEHGQIETKQAAYTSTVSLNQGSSSNKKINYMDYVTYQNNTSEEEANDNEQALERKRSLRSSKTECPVVNGNSEPDTATKAKVTTSGGEINSTDVSNLSLRLLPEEVHNQDQLPPCLIYGAVHLTRLFVKLPELLAATNIDERKWKTLSQHLDLFIEFLHDHREWFGEQFYIDK